MMKTSSLLHRTALAAGAILLTQCAMPPRDAWRIVQNDGLFPYLMGTYSYQPVPTQPRSPSAAPFQPATQSLVSSPPRVPYRSEYVPNRYLAGSYYEPQRSTVRSRPDPEPIIAPDPKPERTPSPRRERSDDSDSSSTASAPKRKTVNKEAPPIDKPIDEPPTKLSMDDLPFGTPVSGRPGMVNSPFASKDQLVDVTGMSVGETVKCPYSGKLFRVPPTQAASTPKSTPPSTPEPSPSEEPKPTPDATSTPEPAPAPAPTSEPEAPAPDAEAKPKSA